ncbi:hypothetical protein B296_00019377 [Ensete ventricosum]|uniref:Uncharacterized protein n=1 Tax=Ensete ventricosum TaxID=4639 RepID=A0A426Y2K1_ENSVE|nr:hypothetical protein B296_00019377 [Ensete ventricosum]
MRKPLPPSLLDDLRFVQADDEGNDSHNTHSNQRPKRRIYKNQENRKREEKEERNRNLTSDRREARIERAADDAKKSYEWRSDPCSTMDQQRKPKPSAAAAYKFGLLCLADDSGGVLPGEAFEEGGGGSVTQGLVGEADEVVGPGTEHGAADGTDDVHP